MYIYIVNEVYQLITGTTLNFRGICHSTIVNSHFFACQKSVLGGSSQLVSEF